MDQGEFASPNSYIKQDHLDKDMVRDAFGSLSPRGNEEPQIKPKKREKGEPSDQLKQEMFDNIMEHVPQWRAILQSVQDLKFKRLNGNSNACFKVSIREGLYPEESQTRALLYRKYE